MKKRLINIFSVIILTLITITNVNARAVIDAGENFTSKGTYESSRFVFGNDIKTEETVDGLEAAAGNNVKINSTVEYGTYAGNSIHINANIEKDLFVAGNIINVESDSVIGRDAYIAGNDVKINVNVGRDLRVAASIVDISGITINGDAKISAEKIMMDEKTTITGRLIYTEGTEVEGADKASIKETIINKNEDVQVSDTIYETISSLMMSMASSFIVMAALLYMMPKTKEKIDKNKLNFNEIITNSSKGLVALIVIPFISIIGLITGLFAPLSLIVLALYVIGIYLSALISSYLIGKLIISKLGKKGNDTIAAFIGIILIKAIALIPIIGGFISFVAMINGIGILYNIVKKEN